MQSLREHPAGKDDREEVDGSSQAGSVCSEGVGQETTQAMQDRAREWLMALRSQAEDLQDLPAKSRRKRKKVLQNLLGEVRALYGCESDVLRALFAEVELLLEGSGGR